MGDLTRKMVKACLIVAAGWCAVVPVRSSVGQSRERTATPDHREIERLIEELGSPDYTVREGADHALREIGLPATEALAAAFHATDDYEQRLRIRIIAEHIFFWDRVLGKNGFLGIQHRRYDQSQFYRPGDTRIPSDVAAFAIEQVIADTAAEEAGLEAGDIIVAVDGNRLPAGSEVTAFADQIRGKLPGTKMTFEIWRGNKEMTMHIAIGHRPREYYIGRNLTSNLKVQYDSAVEEFPKWWAARFGPWMSAGAEKDRRYLPLPDPYDSRGR